jgi:phosphoribosyl 1,2-cyclic phosphodiesterase
MITIETLGSSSAGNCYRLLSGGRSLLLECGLPWRAIRRELNFETTDLDGCLVSHEHGDHSRAIHDLTNAGIDVYASHGTLEAVGLSGHHRANVICHAVNHVIANGWIVVPFHLVHDAAEPMGFLISNGESSMVFITDTAYCKYRMPRPMDIIMIEANYSEAILAANVDAGRIDPARAKRVRENHLSIERVLDFLKANDTSKCRQIHLLHLSDGNSDADLFKRMVQEATGTPVYVE